MPTVLITGAASGIGRAAAHRFAADGWRCVLVDRDGEGLAGLRPALPGAHVAHVADLTDAAQVAGLASLSETLDAVVNNAGASDPRGVSLVDQPADEQARLAALNLEAPAAVLAAVDARLAPGARIVAVASGAGLRAIPQRGWYSATKAGLIAQTRAFACARPDLVVTVLCPGFVRTELVDALIAAGRLDPRQAVAKTPLGRMAEPREMAATLRFLASPDAAPLHGGVIRLCGGSSVYGGSRGFEPAVRAPRPSDTGLALSVVGDAHGAWSAAAASAGSAASPYRGVVDASPLAPQGAGGLLAAVHASARRFAAAHPHDASLTLLLPARDPQTPAAGPHGRPGRPDVDPLHEARGAGDAAAARMLVATLACELAPRALRVNAIGVPADARPGRLVPLLRHVAGADAQFLTGQTLEAGAASRR